MILPSLITLAFATSVFASPQRRSNSLIVDLVGPGSVSSVDDLQFTARITNTGPEDIKILKYATILDDKLPTRSFAVTKDGVDVPFIGVKLFVSLTNPNESSFTTIPANGTVTVNHNVAPLFDFAASGAGTYTFEPVTNFKVQGTEEKALVTRSSMVQAPTTKVEVVITGDVTNRKLPGLDKRAVNRCRDPSQNAFINSSYIESKELATRAVSYINANGTNALFKAYWGNNDPSRVISALNAVASENSTTRALNCADILGLCRGDITAYTLAVVTNIYYCSIFFNELPSTSLCSGTTVASRNIRGATTLHEMTHALVSTQDVTYGCAADQALSDDQSIINADNYNCFTTQVYQDTMC